MTHQNLEQLAVNAHASGERFAAFWHRHGRDVARLEPIDRRRHQRLAAHLMMLVLTGEPTNPEPIDAGYNVPMAWEIDDLEQHAEQHTAENAAVFA